MNIPRKYYEIHDFRFSLRTDAAELEPEIDAMFPALLSKPGACNKEWSVRHAGLKTENSFALYENNKQLIVTQKPDQILEELEWAVLIGILSYHRKYIQIHASGLSRNGKGLLLSGPSGSGKTTLALNMLLDGWSCLSDEVILIDPGKIMILPLPRCFHVDDRTLELIPDIIAEDEEDVFKDNSGKRRFDPYRIRKDWAAEPSSPEWIVFLNNDIKNENRLVRIGETEALSLLIGQTINLAEHGEKGLQFLINLVHRCECYILNAGDLHGVSNTLTGLVG